MSTAVGVKRNKLAAPSVQAKTSRRRRASAAPGPLAHNALTRYQAAFHEWEAVVAYSPRTIDAQRHAIGRFIAWADERGLGKPQDITRPILERYQRHVYHHRKANGQPLTVSAQLGLILPLQAWFKWLTKQNHILYNPAADLDLPTRPKALPKGLLSIAQIEDVLNGCDVNKPDGLRMRAMIEVLYSTGIRRFELAGLKLFDVDVERGALMVRQGKGAKDRMVPVGDRACAWVDKYLREVRPELAAGADDYRLFLDDDGRGFTPERVGDLVRRQLTAAGIERSQFSTSLIASLTSASAPSTIRRIRTSMSTGRLRVRYATRPQRVALTPLGSSCCATLHRVQANVQSLGRQYRRA